MDEAVLDWLPGLILFEDYNRQWNEFLEAVYSAFHGDFVAKRPLFQGVAVYTRYHPAYEGKGATFWHLISEGKEEEERIPDFRRCERIRWPRALIECNDAVRVKVWETGRGRNKQKEKRVICALEDFSYVVILALSGKHYRLITAYNVEYKNRRDRLRKEYEDFLRQKKEGSAG